jgi:hypothetical protein
MGLPAVRSLLLFGSFLALGAAACGREEKPPPPLPADRLANVIDAMRVARPVQEPVHSRLSGIAEGEVAARFKTPPLCRLTGAGRLLLVARRGQALARIDGALSILAFGGPVNPEGGFFTGPGASVSVGRHAPVATAAEAPGVSWPVTVTVGGAAKRPIEKLDAVWTCEL